MEKTKRLFIVISVAFPALLICVFAFREQIAALSKLFPPCLFYHITGYYCPGCGNTRSVLHILSGEFLLSLRCNVAPLFLLSLLVILYIEMTASVFGKHLRILPRSLPFWIIVIALFMVYYVVRNFVGFLAPV